MRFATIVGLGAFALSTGCKKPAAGVPDAGVVAVVVDAGAAAADAGVASLDEIVDAAAPLGATTGTTTTASARDAGHHAAVAPIPFVVGETWNGTYNCGQENTMALKITAVTGDHVNAVFDFKMHNKKTGGFTMSGTYEPATRHLALAPGNWIVQPKGVSTVALDGTVGEDKHAYAGKVTGHGCSTFSSRR